MDVGKWVARVFFVLLAMLAAWMLYSVLLEYPYSTVLSLGTNLVEHDMDMNETTQLVNNQLDDYNGAPTRTKAAIWKTTEMLQIPFGSYYFFYVQLPNMRGDELVNKKLAEGIDIGANKYNYKVLMSEEMINQNMRDTEHLHNNVMGYIPMNLSFDDEDNEFMNYPSDSESEGRFYTTGWY